MQAIIRSGLSIFQSTLPCGSDICFCNHCGNMVISIHAPLRERLFELLQNISINTGFQSTLPCGSDNYVVRPFDQRSHFNPRSLAGATAACFFAFVLRSYFNPRSLAGATATMRDAWVELLISIHAPLRERPSFTP